MNENPTMEQLEKAFIKRDKSLAQQMRKNELALMRTDVKYTQNVIEKLKQEYDSLMKEAEKNGMPYSTKKEIDELKNQIETETKKLAVTAEKINHLQSDMGPLAKVKDSIQNLSKQNKETLSSIQSTVSKGFWDKIGNGISSLKRINKSIGSFNEFARGRSKTTVKDLATICAEDIRSTYRAYQLNSIDISKRTLNSLEKLQETTIKTADRANTIGTRLQNVGKALMGKEFVKETPKSHDAINEFFNEQKAICIQEMKDAKEKCNESLKHSCRAWRKNNILKEVIGVDKDMKRTKRQQREHSSQRGQLTQLDRQIKSAEHRLEKEVAAMQDSAEVSSKNTDIAI